MPLHTCARVLPVVICKHGCPRGRVNRQARAPLHLPRKQSLRPRRSKRLIISHLCLHLHPARASMAGSPRGISRAPTRPCSCSHTSSSTGWVCHAPPSPVHAPAASSPTAACCASLLKAWQSAWFPVKVWMGAIKTRTWLPTSSSLRSACCRLALYHLRPAVCKVSVPAREGEHTDMRLWARQVLLNPHGQP